MKEAEAKRVWLEAVERVKDRTLAPTLWRALEMGTGITLDGDLFIIGFSSADAPMAGYLVSSDHKNVIEKALTEIVGRPVRLKTIEGSTPADYETHKQREVVAEETRRVAQERKHVERAAERQWEMIMEQCSRKYANTPLRQLPHIRSQFMFEAVNIVSEAMDEIHPDGKIDEIGHRAMGRVVDKIATLADVPGAVVGAELIRVRRAKKAAGQ
jgi:hypothetical protein